jgi:hypothetical protein
MGKKKKKPTVPTKEIVFKLIELPLYQFLAEKSWDEEENYTIVLTFYLKGLKCTQTLAYHKEEDRDEQWLTLTADYAQMIIDKTTKLLK